MPEKQRSKIIIYFAGVFAFLAFVKTATENTIWILTNGYSIVESIFLPNDQSITSQLLEATSCGVSQSKLVTLINDLKFQKFRVHKLNEYRVATKRMVLIVRTDENEQIVSYQVVSLDREFHPQIHEYLLTKKFGRGYL